MSFGGVKVVNKNNVEGRFTGQDTYIVFDTYQGMGFYCCKALRTAMYKRYMNINYYIIKG